MNGGLVFEHFRFPIDIDDIIERLQRRPINPEHTYTHVLYSSQYRFKGHFTLNPSQLHYKFKVLITLNPSHHYPLAVLASGHS